jgi:hypothetical protein
MRWWLLGGAAFAGIAIAFAGSKPGQVMQREALDIAQILENATMPEHIRPLLDLQIPVASATPDAPATATDISDGVAGMIAALKEKATYTFVFVGFDQKGNRTLLFRVHKSVHLYDYHRLRLERRNGAARVTAIEIVSLGGWLDAMTTKVASAVDAAGALLSAQTIRYPKGPQVAPEGVPPGLRRTLPFAALHLWWLVTSDPQAFPTALAEFRKDHPRNCAADLVIATRWLTLGMKQEEAIAALNHIEEGVGDPDFMQQLREKVMK